MFVTAIYKSRHTREVAFDETVHRFGKGQEGWDLIAVVRIPAGEFRVADPNDAHTLLLVSADGTLTAQEVLDGAGPMLAWHRAMPTR